MTTTLAGSCHCGAVQLVIPRLPDVVTQCNCTLCTKLGTRWAYFPPDEVSVSGGPLADYVRSDLRESALVTQRCQSCGCTVCWRALDAEYARMGVNANLFDIDVVDGLPLNRVSGRDWDA